LCRLNRTGVLQRDFFSAPGTQNGFLQTIFSLVWMGFDNEAHYFFSTDPSEPRKKTESKKRVGEAPPGQKSDIF
uniref:hypothetical protein n=1 Tax=Candidatus Limisoma sp. TaxID=3076476 RepID=UPI003FF00D9D